MVPQTSEGNPMQYLHWSALAMYSNSPLRAISRTIAKLRVNLWFLQRFDSSFHPKFSFRSSAISRCFSGFLWLGLACLAPGCMVRRLRSWNSLAGNGPHCGGPLVEWLLPPGAWGFIFGCGGRFWLGYAPGANFGQGDLESLTDWWTRGVGLVYLLFDILVPYYYGSLVDSVLKARERLGWFTPMCWITHLAIVWDAWYFAEICS